MEFNSSQPGPRPQKGGADGVTCCRHEFGSPGSFELC